MDSKQEASQLREAFWTAFGQYMSPVLSAERLKINWLNYKTGVRFINFRLYANTKKARIAIEISHPDPVIRQMYYDRFLHLKTLLHHTLPEEWHWQPDHRDENGKIISSISHELRGVNVFQREHWPPIISFFKPRMIALDEFWSNAKYGFESVG